MVCEKCQKKLSKVIVPDKWKEGASNTTESSGRKVNENKLLSKKHRFEIHCLRMDTLWKYKVHHLQAASASRCQVLSHLCLFQRRMRDVR
ncbi:hypothetical protein ES332_D06G266200v1 [Gossypium tomentosum]|uniref:Cysteine-rich PDZ-binding protein n=1 Tax=Gossypium tomentosum TaxID=34277 RepID=A0A5D2KP87_GOSTO|nr:hypothetical protein ES332_D06G266200v1 [Gossypium tomentosum]